MKNLIPSENPLRPVLFPKPGTTCTGLAAASLSGEPMASWMLRATAAKGRTAKRSPTLPAPASRLKFRPSITVGRLGTTVLCPSDKRMMFTPPPSKRIS
jgi:hypothetical protein